MLQLFVIMSYNLVIRRNITCPYPRYTSTAFVLLQFWCLIGWLISSLSLANASRGVRRFKGTFLRFLQDFLHHHDLHPWLVRIYFQNMVVGAESGAFSPPFLVFFCGNYQTLSVEKWTNSSSLPGRVTIEKVLKILRRSPYFDGSVRVGRT